jgi:hypothetical protein
MEMKKEVNDSAQLLVNERGKTHGNFGDHARVTQRLKEVIQTELADRVRRQQPYLTATQIESLEMIAHKIGRIVAGDPNFKDHWDDIAGYARIANAQP